jgi:predicted transcriptional regulator
MPDDIFRRAESAAKFPRVSRSKLYANAITEFLGREHADAITEKLNEVYAGRRAAVDPGLNWAQLRSVETEFGDG